MYRKTQLKLKHYPKMTAQKSFLNVLRQKLISMIGRFLRRHRRDKEVNLYHKKLYQPVEEIITTTLKISGIIPPHLNGLLLRIGSNPIKVEKPTLFEWYLGHGMIHALKLQAGKAIWFKSSMLSTDTVQQYKQQPAIGGFRRGAHDVVNTNIFKHAGKLWAVIEAGAFPICLDDELNAERYQLFNSDADLPFTAHPRKDIKTGHLHAISYDALDRKNAYYQVIDQHGDLIHVTQILLQHGPMIHDCLITQQEVLVFDFPLTFSMTRLLHGASVPYQWNKQHPARIGILPKYANAEQIQWIELEPCFVFHAANAFRDHENTIILDVLVHQDDFEHSQHAAYELQHAQLERWRIDLSLQTLHRTVLDSRIQEFPKIDARFTGVAYRYLYTLGFAETALFNCLYIYDLEMQTSVSYDFGTQWAIGEVTFVAEHEHSAEGQGYLMAYLHHVEGEAAKAVILKVNGLEIAEQAEIDLGVHIPLGFHCNWVESDANVDFYQNNDVGVNLNKRVSTSA
ncbi:carotenoid oxygenase family protein [Acinetobacter guillouiae]|uniref:carotenoid oxygenase family protein n=1 Tax=Acinetobacter TaxID=469 RepID=UPI001FB9853A|nr:carotenoid oxygenase family protein [Acinetobacter sp. NyZ410]UOH19549.1 carotenoid oxygenase family protein [Acinetobacter sp. NyZ410]